MSNTRIAAIAMAIAFWPGLSWLLSIWHKTGIVGPARVSGALFFGVIIWVWVGIAAVALFGDHNNAR